MLERRNFLTALTAAMATTLVPGGIVAATLTQREICAMQPSTQDLLARLIGNTFHLTDSNGEPTQARLVAVDEGPQCEGLEQFSIVFEGTDLCDGIYKVYHRDTGSVPISLMPSVARTPATVRKRAYFTLFV